ncbi:glycosyltransferase [Flexithrix dorotheae]|uniref:glycosyltransferase n=1 Tax=Flexithrix dorotheae TaxID=70993 RepID=UPI00039E5C4C|nr:glycosyltransferase [Flexithrix dorotheae]
MAKLEIPSLLFLFLGIGTVNNSLLDFFLTCTLTGFGGLQLFFIFFVFSRLIFFREQINPNHFGKISVVIAARNEYENLKKLIPALKAQSHQNFEVIIVDDRSEDGSLALLNSFKKKFDALKIIRVEELKESWNPKKHALHLGIKKASSDIILLTDADCLPVSNDWISIINGKYGTETSLVLGVGVYQKKPGLLNLFIQFETLYTALQYLGFALAGKPYMGVGRNLSYRKSIILDSGLFNGIQNITGGDDDLIVNKVGNKRNVRIVINKESQTISAPPETFFEWYNQKIRHLSVGVKYNLENKVFLGTLNFSHIGFYFCILILSLLNNHWLIVSVFYLFRILALTLIIYFTNKKLKAGFPVMATPFVDILYVFYYVVIGFASISTKKILWK